MILFRSKGCLVVLCAIALNVSCVTKTVSTFDEGESLIDEQSNLNSLFSAEHLDLIANDMVSVMIQVQKLNPLTTTMQYSKPSNQLGELLIEKIRLAGYGMQEVSADQGVYYIGYKTRSIEGNANVTTDIVISVAGIEIRREYKVQDGHIVPASLMYVNGIDSLDNIVLNENLFLQQSDSIQFESGVELELPNTSVLSSLPRNVGAGSDTESTGDNQNAILEARRNLLSKSNDEILATRAQYRDLVKGLLRFQGGQLTVGRKNKAVLKQITADFDESKDAIFISSCVGDHGEPDKAAQRSSRIKEELGLSGISINLIVEMGCIQSNYPDGNVEPESVVLIRSRIDAGRTRKAAEVSPKFPTRPLVMTIPYSVGGATDFQARTVTMLAKEEEHLGQPIQYVYKTGQSGRDGWSWFAESASNNGYDIASYSVPHFIAQSIKYETPYNIDTLEPIANWGADPSVLLVASDSPFRSVIDFVRAARASPGKLKVSGAGEFVGHHIALLQLEKATNIKTDYISDKGGAGSLQQIISGEVQAGFSNMSDAYRQGKQVRILAIADLERNAVIPGVPTFLEMNINVDDSSVNYRGLMVPKGTPPEIIDRLSEAAIKMFNNEAVIEKMKDGGAPLQVMNRESVIAMWYKRRAQLAVLLRGQ